MQNRKANKFIAMWSPILMNSSVLTVEEVEPLALTENPIKRFHKDYQIPDMSTVRPDNDRTNEIADDMLLWATIDISLMIFIFCGNTLTILAIGLSRRLRLILSNWFVLSLAMSDMLVGITLPYHMTFYLRTELGRFHLWCMLRFFLIIIACCVSIWNLIAIAVDRYVAIVYPLHYVRFMTRRIVLTVMCLGWVVGATVGVVPMFWNNWATAVECEFDEVLPPWYMAGIVTPLFAGVWLCMLVLYVKIWMEAAKQAKQMRASFSGAGLATKGGSDWKSIQLVLLILGCFSVCWLPYFIVACAQIFQYSARSSPTVYKAAFTLALGNSGMNPLIYAWKNTALRTAFGRLLRFRHPDHPAASKSSTNRRRVRRAEALADRRRPSSTVAIDDAPEGISGKMREHTASKTADFVKPKGPILILDTEWNGNRSGSLNDQRLVDILHLDIGVVEKTRGMPSDTHRFSTSILPR